MALPREVIPNSCYMITRRCFERRLYLLPHELINEAFFYCLGIAAEHAGVELLFSLANSNHHHTGIYDRYGTYPDFIQHFHKLLARCVNAIRGRNDSVFSSEQANVVRLVEPNDVFEKMIYALTNPVKDHLVQHAHQWPGASSLAATRDGATITVKRPAYFRNDGDMPESVTCQFQRPPGFTDWSAERWALAIEERVDTLERQIAAELRRTGRFVMGRKNVVRQSWNARPMTRERRGRKVPIIAAKSKWARVEALQRNKAFLVAYRRARVAFMEGTEPIPFPPGTYFRNKPKVLSAAWFAVQESSTTKAGGAATTPSGSAAA